MRSTTTILVGATLTAMLVVGVTWKMTSERGPETQATEEQAAVALPMPEPTTELTSGIPLATPPVAAPPSAPSPRPATSTVRDAEHDSLRVARLVVATGVDQREPLGASEVFDLGAVERIYAFVEAANAADEPADLTVTFEPQFGESAGHVTLTVPPRAARFRTWAFSRNVRSLGEWQAVVRASDGTVVASVPFVVE